MNAPIDLSALALETLTVRPGPKPGWVTLTDGRVTPVPTGWVHVPPGDPALTRRIKAQFIHWVVEEKRGRKVFSRGLYTDPAPLARLRATLETERADPAYAKKLAQAARKREVKQTEYVEDFHSAVLAFLRFHPKHAAVAEQLAKAVTTHATPVGSGTVARTERIAIEERAEAAVLAWMRHQTTDYDQQTIARIKGARQAVRRKLGAESRGILQLYRSGEEVSTSCPLQVVLGFAPDASQHEETV